MKALLSLLTAAIVSFGANAQNFVKGYVINDKGDTLKGEIKLNPKKEQDAYLKVTLKDASGALKNFKPEKARGYGYENKHFVVMEWGGEKNFFLILTKGQLTLYKLVAETVRMNESVYESEYYVLVSGETELIQLKTKKFKKQLAELTKDKPDVAASYPEEKEFNIDHALEAITHYNNAR